MQATDQPQEWELINPTGEIEKVAVEPAKRITALEGKTIALRWNGKEQRRSDCSTALPNCWPRVSHRQGREDVPRHGRQNLNKISATQDESMRIVKAVASVRPDIVIASLRPTEGNCTSWLLVDQSNLEKSGIPTVTIVTDPSDPSRGTQKSQASPTIAL